MFIVCRERHTVNSQRGRVSCISMIYDALSSRRVDRKRGIIRSVQALARPGFLRKQARFFLCATLAGLALRLFLVIRFPGIVDDSRLYADIADNWLRHGIYGITNSGVIMPTLSRLPAYPAFLAAIFAVFGIDNFRAVLLVQVPFDLATCFLVADIARRLFSERAAKAAFLLAALCPFLANYSAAALTETLEIFFTALALDLAFFGLRIGGLKIGGVKSDDQKIGTANPSTRLSAKVFLVCGLAIGIAILLRPDGGMLLAVIGGYLLWLLLRNWRNPRSAAVSGLTPRDLILAGVLLAVGAITPLIPWTVRNLHTLHRFEPLAPRYANDADEPVMTGFNRWTKTWIADYVSVEEIYWNVPGEDIDVNRLPRRAFDSPAQHDVTRELFADYNRSHDMPPELDKRFAALADERIQAAPLRYYVWLPCLRIADMWLRPRTELFNADPRWWEFNDERRWLALSLVFGAINLCYVLLAGVGFLRARHLFGIGLFVLFLLLRSAFLGTLENPEPRYTLEMYPAVIVMASRLFHRSA
jgi:4-amino-4-deoxy-L-arabinose transferase-like glycosyltransferase